MRYASARNHSCYRPSRDWFICGRRLVDGTVCVTNALVVCDTVWLDQPHSFCVLDRDVYPSNGLLRKRYKKLQSFSDFSGFKCTPEFFNLGDNHGGNQKFFKVFLTFQFRKKTKVDAIRMRATCYRYLASKIKQKIGAYEWIQGPNTVNTTPYYERTEQEIPIAYIPETHGNPGVYGDKQVNGYFLADGTAHYIEVELHSGRRIQRKTIQIFMPHMNESFDPPWDVIAIGFYFSRMVNCFSLTINSGLHPTRKARPAKWTAHFR